MTEMAVKSIVTMMCAIILSLILFLSVGAAQAKDYPTKQVKGLGEQVHDIKSNVLSIAKKLSKLEERLLYPSHTQISVFVSLREKARFHPDSIEIEFNGKQVAYHLYTPREVEALSRGGVQRLYTGNVAIGEHQLKATIRGKSADGENVRIDKSFPVEKTVKPGIAELLLSENSITLINR